ncbi:histidine phosphatase family protein [Labrys sp. KB_33_2]|uniref:SixA phosphatase family protein n=1 Tax=Labrys sp. KB_33_2 TaxID=3237479 RepID=UPI003F916E18
MKRLMLLRHAKSDYPAGVSDHERPLAPRGQRDAPRMGREIARRSLLPDHVIASTARRTRETLTLIEGSLGPHTLHFERAIYEAPPEAILRVIRTVAPEIGTLLVVGHNPGLEQVAAFLTRGAGTVADPLSGKFPTAALAVLDFEIDDWNEIAGHQGSLALFLTPKALDR